jgi:ribonuclease HI
MMGQRLVIRAGRVGRNSHIKKETMEALRSLQFTTASEMELTAAIEALKSPDAGCSVTLAQTAATLIHGMQFLVDRWHPKEWNNTTDARCNTSSSGAP